MPQLLVPFDHLLAQLLVSFGYFLAELRHLLAQLLVPFGYLLAELRHLFLQRELALNLQQFAFPQRFHERRAQIGHRCSDLALSREVARRFAPDFLCDLANRHRGLAIA